MIAIMSTSPLAEELALICRQFPIDALYVFGSRAEEIAGRLGGADAVVGSPSTSDLDIGLQTRPGQRLDAKQRVELSIRLEDLFDVSRVDLVVLEEAPPFLALAVIRGELIFCADPYRQAEFELYVLRRAADLAPFERRRREDILRGSSR